jgi:hypothetical protein
LAAGEHHAIDVRFQEAALHFSINPGFILEKLTADYADNSDQDGSLSPSFHRSRSYI